MQKLTSTDILYLDNHILVVNKPAGIPTQPIGTDPNNLEDFAKTWLKFHFNKPGNVFLQPIYRLDKPVSGIVLFARTSKALSRLMQFMREKQYKKIYHAQVEGRLSQSQGTLEHYLIHDDHFAKVVSKQAKHAKYCRLHYCLLKSNFNTQVMNRSKEQNLGLMDHSKNCLVEIILETGRYHQIRAQFGAIGHPISGDLKYGATQTLPTTHAILLHHYQLQINHPISKKTCVWEAPYPSYWPLPG